MLGYQVCIVGVWRVSSTACRGIDDSMEAMGTGGACGARGPVSGQIARASSVNAAATRLAGGASVPSS